MNRIIINYRVVITYYRTICHLQNNKIDLVTRLPPRNNATNPFYQNLINQMSHTEHSSSLSRYRETKYSRLFIHTQISLYVPLLLAMSTLLTPLYANRQPHQVLIK